MKVNSLVGDFKEFLKSSKIWKIKVTYKNERVVLVTSIFNYRWPIYVLAAFLIFTSSFFQPDEGFRYYRIVFFYCIFFIFLWIEFNDINSLVLDLEKKKLIIKSKNIFKRFFCLFTEDRVGYDFSTISSIEVKFNDSSFYIRDRTYDISVVFRDDRKRMITSFKKEQNAKKYAEFVTNLMTF